LARNPIARETRCGPKAGCVVVGASFELGNRLVAGVGGTTYLRSDSLFSHPVPIPPEWALRAHFVRAKTHRRRLNSCPSSALSGRSTRTHTAGETLHFYQRHANGSAEAPLGKSGSRLSRCESVPFGRCISLRFHLSLARFLSCVELPAKWLPTDFLAWFSFEIQIEIGYLAANEDAPPNEILSPIFEDFLSVRRANLQKKHTRVTLLKCDAEITDFLQKKIIYNSSVFDLALNTAQILIFWCR
jgi:hypothetical protein